MSQIVAVNNDSKPRHLFHHEIDKEKWDNCIKSSVNGLVYATSWYLDIVCPNWEALVIGDYETVMPLPVKRKFGIPYLFRPTFAQQLGVFSKLHVSELIINVFIDSLPPQFKLVNITGNYLNIVKGACLKQVHSNYELVLDKDYNTLSKSFTENHIRNIRKAQKNNLLLRTDLSIQELIDFKKQNNEVFVSDNDLFLLEKLLSAADSRDKLSIYSIHNSDGFLLACVSFLVSNNRIVYLFSISSNEGKNMRAMFLLVNSVIKEYAISEKILDFEGSDIPQLAFFYSGFGAISVNYPAISINKLPWFLKILKHK